MEIINGVIQTCQGSAEPAKILLRRPEMSTFTFRHKKIIISVHSTENIRKLRNKKPSETADPAGVKQSENSSKGNFENFYFWLRSNYLNPNVPKTAKPTSF